ncbi:ABC transporter family substrate-binding protein [Microbacterium sp. SSW1-59]|uniref:ABC transporter family substrate-binding protein n=1 Tax=Microbacterium xanthum TaxID=3079794 RepID=UPI002AD20659|nr:ABC transporter family substrate-binding protein [Microbacterium sp. SSW1-59]MDZ8202165.1 ABC transporter family substrate-binding protein [Microbacterium sp. SSW1-59]
MKRTRLAAGAGLITAGALALAGCSVPYESEVIEDTEITVSWNDIIDNFNTASTSGNNVANSNVTYMTTSAFNYYNDSPELVQNTEFGSYEKTSDDPLTVEYTINEDVVWSDGTPVDEADMLLSWAYIFGAFETEDGFLFNYANPRPELATQVPEIEDNKLTLVYDVPYVDWEVQFSTGSVAAHAAVMLAYPEIEDPQEAKDQLVEAIQNGDEGWLAPVAEAWELEFQQANTPDNELVTLSYGPYIVEELVEEDYVTLVANESFAWGPSPKYQRVTIRQIADPTAQVQSLQNQDVQVASGQPTPDVLQLVQETETADYYTGDEATYEHVDLTFNNGGPFDPATYGGDEDKAQMVRTAFLKTIPREEIVEKLIRPLNPNAEVRNSILQIPGSPMYDPIVEANGSAEYGEVDIEGAKQLLADAGVEAPVDVKFWYPEGNERRAAEYELIATSGALAGFNVIDDSEPNWEFTDTAANPINPHDAVIFAWASTSLALTGTDQYLGTGQPSNFGGYSNEIVDQRLKDLETELDEDEQIQIQIDVEKELWTDGYGITLYQFPGLTAWDKGVEGIAPAPLAPYYFWNFWEWAPTAGADAE